VFWFLLIAMVVVIAAVTLAVVGGGEDGVLPEAPPEQLVDPLPVSRPVAPSDIEALRLPVVARGYRMADVDDVLDRLAVEIMERDARIAELRSRVDGTTAPASPEQAPRAPGPAGPGTSDPGAGLFDKRPAGPDDTRRDPADGPSSAAADESLDEDPRGRPAGPAAEGRER
jgi:DivIVA domain-containing protein